MAEWVQIFLALTPLMAWFFVGVGVPWALAILPRQDWADRSVVVALGLALGPLFGSLWLFVLGTVGRFSAAAALGGTGIIAVLGAWLAWRRRNQIFQSPQQYPTQIRFKGLERVLWIMMAVGLAASAWDTAFWPFLRYDTLWTFGYNSRVFMLEGYIPQQIDYYPQLVPLTFTYGQLIWGDINDHAARAAVPWFILSSTMSAYVLGWRVYGQRLIGAATAALWVLIPSVLVWSSAGDLEHVVAIYFTSAATFIVLAWRMDDERQVAAANRYAIIAGLMVGGAMWTKPTAGAFVFGMALAFVGVLLWGAPSDRWAWRQRKIWLLVRVGLIAAPIGGGWYVRNVIVGHAWTNLPAAYWQDLAQRSGMQLDALWALLMLAVVGALGVGGQAGQWWRVVLVIVGGLLISIAILPTLLSVPDDGWRWQTSWDMINGFREPHRRLYSYEGGLLFLGMIVLAVGGWPAWHKIPYQQRLGFVLTWALGLPFFAVYFWSFSYHYRLMLSVLPIMLAPIAALLVALVVPPMIVNRARRLALMVAVVWLALPAPIAASYHTWRNTLESDDIRTDAEKYRYANPALMDTVVALENYARRQGRDSLRVLAPGENRLAFFFPTWDIDDETLPVDLNDLEGYDVLVISVADFLWHEAGRYPNQVQAWTKTVWGYPLAPDGYVWAMDGPAHLPLPRYLKPIVTPIDDGTFHYELFAIDSTAPTVYIEPTFYEDERTFSAGMQLLGYDVPTEMVAGESYLLKFYWRGASVPPNGDYSIFLHLTPLDDPTTILAQADGGLIGGAYPTRFLTDNMIFQDRRVLTISPTVETQNAVLRIGVYDPASGMRFTISLTDGVVADSLTLQPLIEVRH